MALKSLGNPDSSFNDYLGRTGNDAFFTQIITTSGGTKIENPSGGYFHVFTTSDSFTILEETFGDSINLQILIVSGGGGGGGQQGGGGGAGGIVHGSSVPISPGTYPVVIGSGGVGAPGFANGTQGSPSSFSSVTAIGGGAGLQNNYGYPSPKSPAAAGGSSGGAGGGGLTSGPNSTPVTPQPVPGDYIAYGNIGGAQANTNGGAGSGGGGAGGTGTPGGTSSGNGGNARSFSDFPSTILAPAIPAPVRPSWSSAVGPTGLFGGGGGGGGSSNNPVPNPNGGGAGAGSGHGGGTPNDVRDAVDYTGSGGAGEYYPMPATRAGNGAIGIVIIKVP